MIGFLVTLCILISVTVIIQLLSKMKIVGGNELGIISGKGGQKGFTTISGGRVFIMPIFHKFAKIALTPYTIEVLVDSAIASGVVPLNVKATVSFAIASNQAGRNRAVTRILGITSSSKDMRSLASSIIEGHLRDAIASMTTEQVMQDKDTLVANMIAVCKNDLENIGLEITTMNIADVDDHRLEGVTEPDLYIALLKRIQTTNAKTQAREAKASTKATAVEEQEERRADVEVRAAENEYENLLAETRVKVAEENQRKTVGMEEMSRQAEARLAGLKSQLEAEKQNNAMLKARYEAEVITPAKAVRERMVIESKEKAASISGKAQAEIDQFKQTMKILSDGKQIGMDTFIIENFESLIQPFAATLSLFPVSNLSVITGAEGKHEPISAIHPNAVEEEKNKYIAGAISNAMKKPKSKEI